MLRLRIKEVAEQLNVSTEILMVEQTSTLWIRSRALGVSLSDLTEEVPDEK